MFQKLKKRLILLNMSIITIVMVGSFSVIYVMSYTSVNKENQEQLQRISEMSLQRASVLGLVVDEFQVQMNTNEYAIAFSVYIDEEGQPVSGSSSIGLSEQRYAEATARALGTGENQSTIEMNGQQLMFMVTRTDVRIAMVPVGQETLQVKEVRQITFLDITDTQKIFAQLLFAFAVIGVGMLVVIYFVSVYFANRSVAPIEEAYSKQKQFIADASHELKTPIASIRANVDALLLNETETITSQKKWLDYMSAETDRMEGLVKDLLYLAKTEHDETATERLTFDLSRTLNDVILSKEVLLFEKGVTLSKEMQEPILVESDERKWAQLMHILFDNACKYSNTQGTIHVELKQYKHKVQFAITNTGEGIAEEHIPHVFDRFYRADASRQHDGGYGLGLAIAKALAQQLNGELRVMSKRAEKTTFTFTANTK
ncbi:MAG: sensor histidine kinase [Bacilli bacterium]